MKLAILLGLTLVTLAFGQIVHNKASILKSGHALITAADSAIAELAKSGKSFDTHTLKNEQAQLRKLVAELEAATEQSAITRIGEQTHQMELTISREIQKINILLHGPPDY